MEITSKSCHVHFNSLLHDYTYIPHLPNIRSLHPTIQTLRSEGFSRFCSHTALLHNRGRHGGSKHIGFQFLIFRDHDWKLQGEETAKKDSLQKTEAIPIFSIDLHVEIPTYLIISSQLRGPALGVFWGPTHHKLDFRFTNCKSSGSLGIISHSHLGHIVLVNESRFSRYVSSYIQTIKGFPSACVNVCT